MSKSKLKEINGAPGETEIGHWTSKAFDSEERKRLICKLEGVGVRGKVLSWIREWLTGRRQRDVLSGEM